MSSLFPCGTGWGWEGGGGWRNYSITYASKRLIARTWDVHHSTQHHKYYVIWKFHCWVNSPFNIHLSSGGCQYQEHNCCQKHVPLASCSVEVPCRKLALPSQWGLVRSSGLWNGDEYNATEEILLQFARRLIQHKYR